MYKCEKCGQLVPPCTCCNFVVTEFRPVHYITKIKKEGYSKTINESNGFEVLKEKKVCEGCKSTIGAPRVVPWETPKTVVNVITVNVKKRR